MSTNQGWWFPSNARSAHYIRGGRSLCGKWGYLGDGSALDNSNPGIKSSEDCTTCRRKLDAEKDTKP